MALPISAIIGRLAQQGVVKIAGKATSKEGVKFGRDVTRTLATGAARGNALPAVENLLTRRTAQAGVDVIRRQYQKTSIHRAVAAKKAQVGDATYTRAVSATEQVAATAKQHYQNWLLKDPYTNWTRQTQVLNAWHSPMGRFSRRVGTVAGVDYATSQAINVVMYGADYLVPQAGATNERDTFSWNPYGKHVGTEDAGEVATLAQADERTKRDQLIKYTTEILVASQVIRARRTLTQTATRLRSHAGIGIPHKADMPRWGSKLYKDTAHAKKYYGSRLPEVAGTMAGSALALQALGASPTEAYRDVTLMQAADAAAGFYNADLPKGQRVMTFKEMEQQRRRIMKKYKL